MTDEKKPEQPILLIETDAVVVRYYGGPRWEVLVNGEPVIGKVHLSKTEMGPLILNLAILLIKNNHPVVNTLSGSLEALSIQAKDVKDRIFGSYESGSIQINEPSTSLKPLQVDIALNQEEQKGQRVPGEFKIDEKMFKKL